MKKATCAYLGGCCDALITGSTPEEMGENCKKHVMALVSTGDANHLAAIERWKTKSQEDMKQWFEEFAKNFEGLEDA